MFIFLVEKCCARKKIWKKKRSIVKTNIFFLTFSIFFLFSCFLSGNLLFSSVHFYFLEVYLWCIKIWTLSSMSVNYFQCCTVWTLVKRYLSEKYIDYPLVRFSTILLRNLWTKNSKNMERLTLRLRQLCNFLVNSQCTRQVV